MSTVIDGLEAIPAPVLLVRDFVNTVEWQLDLDSWHSPSDLANWFSSKTNWERHDLDFNDLVLARRVREGLRSILLMNAGHEPLPRALEEFNDALLLVPLRMSFGANGAVDLASVGSSIPVADPLARVLDAMHTAHAEGSWTRLKACSRDSCRWAYWDSSRNRSGRWCSMSGCGNYIKMRRRNGSVADADEAVIRLSASRAATLVDVAARAGVSMKTVSNVVTGTVRVGDATRERVTAAIEELDYRPNMAARALASRRTGAAAPHAGPTDLHDAHSEKCSSDAAGNV